MRKTALLTGVAGLFLMTVPAFARDGTVLGQLEGARNTEAGQEMTVRGTDGLLRGVPVSGGVRQDGADPAPGLRTRPARPPTRARPPSRISRVPDPTFGTRKRAAPRGAALHRFRPRAV